jgi:hypothetical protein
MDMLLPRKPQDVDRMPDHDHEPAPADPATGPDDRWANEAARSDPDYPAPPAGEGGTGAVNADLEDDGEVGDRPGEPTIHGYDR